MSTAMWKPAGPMSTAEFRTVDPDRIVDIQHKQEAVTRFLENGRFDALLLQRPANFSWFTSGGDCSRAGSPDASASLFITPEARVVVTTNSESAQIFDRELQGLGFLLKERPWHEPRQALVEDSVPRPLRGERQRFSRNGRSLRTAHELADAADVGRVQAAARPRAGDRPCGRSHRSKL